jgi:uncharacterized membrane protein YhiD involved in acid resistance
MEEMEEFRNLTVVMILSRLLLAALISGLIGYERRLHHKVNSIAF